MGSELKQDLVYMKMLSITNEFLKDPIAVYFTDPISQDDEFAAEYFDIIKHPMDLKTLKRNLMDNRYSSINEWAKDFNLIFENAITYNGEGNLISGSARYLQKKFSKKFNDLIYQNSQVFEAKLIELRNKLAILLSSPPANSKMKGAPQNIDIPVTPYTNEKLKALMNQLNSVTNEKILIKIKEILEISGSDSQNTINVNLSRLGRGKLQKLENLLNSAEAQKSKEKEKQQQNPEDISNPPDAVINPQTELQPESTSTDQIENFEIPELPIM